MREPRRNPIRLRLMRLLSLGNDGREIVRAMMASNIKKILKKILNRKLSLDYPRPGSGLHSGSCAEWSL